MAFRRFPVIVIVLALASLVPAACAGPSKVAPSDEAYAPEIDPANFVEVIDNPYWPLTPGRTYIYEGDTGDGLEHIEVEVTHETRVVMGVTCIVVHDSVWVDGELAEDTFDWYVQDQDGNVWYFGEDSTEYENGEAVSTAGSWEAGVDGALPGIVMEAAPKIGDTYRQEYYAGEAEDMAEVIDLGGSETVPFGTFENLLVTREWTPLEPGIEEHKYYARGVGLVLEAVPGGPQRIELIEIRTGG